MKVGGVYSKKGFTLIELLVVIAIIGILASVVLASLNSAREKSRMALKKQQLSQVLTAIQVYRLDHGTSPPNRNSGGWAAIGTSYGGNVALGELVSGGYISSLPTPPDNLPYYYYTYGTYTIVASRMSPPEYGPFPKAWHCSDAAGGAADKIWCIGFDH